MATHQPNLLEEYREASIRAGEIRPKYEDLFWRQPNVWSTAIGFFEDENGNILEIPDDEGGCKRVVGFVIWVTKKVDQNTLSPEDRIPEVIEGIPVQIIEEEALTPADFNFPTP